MTYLFHLYHLFCSIFLSFVFISNVLLILPILLRLFRCLMILIIKARKEMNVIGNRVEHLLAGCPLHGPTVDVPPSIAITSTLLRVTGCSRKISCLLAHRKRNGACFTNRHQPQSTLLHTQDGTIGHDVQNLGLHAAFVNNG